MAALSESLLALSKRLVSRIDTLWAARQQAVYYTALSNTPEAARPSFGYYNGDASSVATSWPQPLRFFTQSA